MAHSRFNPLNQVYVFNSETRQEIQKSGRNGFNPLNQVYVFNKSAIADRFEEIVTA